MSFTQFDFHPKIAAGIKACNYETPTPIQEKAIPAILEGRDILGLAQTGTGKTAAFVLPILQRLLNGPRGRVRTLIVAPTRELAEQIHIDITKLGRQTGIRSIAVYGGVGKLPQIKKIRSGVEIIVACPGRLLDHLRDRTFNLAKVEHLILDEADHMFDMGFLPDIRRILNYLPAERQTLLFSATMPAEIRHLAEETLDNPVRVQIDHSRPIATVAQVLYTVEQSGKTSLLKDIMAKTDMGATLIFTRTKHRAESLARQLQRAGYAATSLQGNLSQQKRQKALNGFKRGEYKVLVATDIAARGIDVSWMLLPTGSAAPAAPPAPERLIPLQAAMTGRSSFRSKSSWARKWAGSMGSALMWTFRVERFPQQSGLPKSPGKMRRKTIVLQAAALGALLEEPQNLSEREGRNTRPPGAARLAALRRDRAGPP
jgi:ATP-dependent RNA helicase RhlE